MPVPFSRLNTPADKPYAIGKRRDRHVPLMPLMSGQEAVDSLIGYYPSAHKMDSELNPHIYQKPNHVRGTTMPHTKTAQLYSRAKQAYANYAVKQIDPSQSQFVAGFLIKCASLTADQLLSTIQEAMAVHPAVCTEFEKCGFVKQAIGFDYHHPAGDFYRGNKPKVSPGVTKPPSSIASKVRPAATSRSVPAVPRKPVPHAQKGVLAQGVTNAGNWLKGFGQSLGSGVGRFGGLLWQGAARASDAVGATQDASSMADAFSDTMDRGVHAGMHNMHAGLTNQDPRETARLANQQGRTTPSGRNWETVDQMRGRQQEALRNQNPADTVFGYGPEAQAGIANVASETGDTAMRAAPSLYLQGGSLVPKPTPLGYIAGANTAYQGMTNPVTEATYNAVGELGETGLSLETAENAFGDTAAFQEGATGFDHKGRDYNGEVQPIGDPRWDSDGQMRLRMTDGSERILDEHGQLQSPNDAQPGYDSPVIQEMVGDPAKYENLVQQDPEGAQNMMSQAEQTVNEFASSEVGQQVISEAQRTGEVQLDTQQQETALGEVAKTLPPDTPPEGILEKFNQMQWPEQLGLSLGLGAGVIGLVQAMTGGGMGSWLMGLLGMGGAAMFAGNAGMLGQDAQGVTQGLTDTVTDSVSGLFGAGDAGDAADAGAATTANDNQPMGSVAGFDITPDRVKSMLPQLLKLPEAVTVPGLRSLAKTHPQLASQLDTAIGHGGTGNALMSFLGDVTGQTSSRMSQYGIEGDNQQELLRLWRLARQTS